jgi:hypothetical protein
VSRGRPRHQASRRRTYSIRRRELRERNARVTLDEPSRVDETVAFEIEEGLDFEAPTSWRIRLNGRSSAA